MSGFDLYNVKRSLVRAGIDPEMFDASAHLDRKLTTRENLTNISKLTGAGRTERHIKKELEKDKARRGGKVKKYRGTFDQTGKSNIEIDRRIRAQPPGKRGSGKRSYYEYRRNRSDRPGSMV
ncbi:MAG TPA: hypothetical protein PK336_00280 [Methanoculleus sp.]|nr:hypothetical protein [Methanoculleus sp.]